MAFTLSLFEVITLAGNFFYSKNNEDDVENKLWSIARQF
jgi:hypothetical protein